MTSSSPGPAITAMWVRDNPVDPALDPRGRGYAPAAADRLVAWARAGGLREVHLVVPPAPGRGPVDDWLADTVGALQDAGVVVSAVADVPSATTAWALSTAALAPWDRLQVAVVPWVGPPLGLTPGEVCRQFSDALDDVVSAGTGLPVDACVPWWFATDHDGDGHVLLEPVLGVTERVALAAPAAHAAGPDGVLERAAPGVRALAALDHRISVAVQTDAPAAAGGPAYTFFDEGPVALLRESAVVAAALGDVPGFEGVAVDSHRAWRRLLGV